MNADGTISSVDTISIGTDRGETVGVRLTLVRKDNTTGFIKGMLHRGGAAANRTLAGRPAAGARRIDAQKTGACVLTRLNYGGIARLFLWVYAAPVFSFWVMLSFLPLAGVLIEGATPVSIIGDAVFLALGFGGLFTLYLTALLFAAGRDVRTSIYGSLRGRVGLASGYATIWLVGYWIFKYLVV